VCSDVVTVAADLYRRGVPVVRIPTTLIGQIDAAVGLKGAVNFEDRKNALGVFRAPAGVLVDPGYLRTLPRQFLAEGMAEIVKIAVVRDPALLAAVELEVPRVLPAEPRPAPAGVSEGIIARAIELMLDELAQNCFEDQSFERRVDFGHTFSPLIEAETGYRIRHGSAVSIDMMLTVALGVVLGLAPFEVLERLRAVLLASGLPVHADIVDEGLAGRSLEAARRHRGGQVNLAVPSAIGQVQFVTDESAIRDAMAPALALVTGRRRRDQVA
jgi:3-dehydroquinate synthase